jgi:nucleoside-diphosphate kinase
VTLADIMVKPDGVQRGLVGEILKRFEQKGFKLVALKLASPSQELLQTHYADLAERLFFPGLITYMVRVPRTHVRGALSCDLVQSSGPVCCMVWEGTNAVTEGRKMLGATKPADSTCPRLETRDD